MIPKGESIQDFVIGEIQTSKTYRMDMERGRIAGYVQGLEAVRQAVYKILNTERYDHMIYSWNYGMELKGLFGMPISYVQMELKRRIAEALTQDERITEVDDFSFEVKSNRVAVTFTVHSVFGELAAKKEVVV